MKDTVKLTIFRDVRNLQYVLWILTKTKRILEYSRLLFDTELAAQKAQRGLAKAFALDGKEVHIDDEEKELTNT